MVLRAEIQQIIERQSDATKRDQAEQFLDLGKVHISTLSEAFIKGRVDEVAIDLALKKNSLHLQSECGCLKKDDQLCVHGLAFLLQLKKRLRSSTSSKGVRYWRQMVHDMTPDQLSKLVIDFARRNKTFALELQAINVANPGDEDPFELAEELLGAIKHPIIRSVKKPSTAHVRLAVNTTKALLKSAVHLIEGEFPVEGSKILVKIIETLHYLAHKRQSMGSTSFKIVGSSQDTILQSLKGIRAPEVNEELYLDIVSLVGKSYYMPINDEFLPGLYQHLKLSSHQKGFLEAVESHIGKSDGHDQYRWLTIWLQCILSQPHNKISSDYRPNAAEQLTLWKIFIKNPSNELPGFLIEILFDNVPPSLLDQAFKVALSDELWEDAIGLLKQGEVNLEVLNSEQASRLLDLVDKKNYEIGHQQKLGLMEVDQNIERIGKFVQDNDSLEVTAEVIHLNTPKNTFIDLDLLKSQIDEFLIHHIGPVSRKTIFKLLDGLEKSQNIALFKSVKQYLHDKYDIEQETSLDSITGLLQ